MEQVLKEEPPQVRTKTAALLDAMRVYVVRVSGSIDKNDPASEHRANALLKPLLEWEIEAAKAEKPEPAATDGEQKPEK